MRPQEKPRGQKKFDEISYLEVISRGLQAMDTTAVTLCMENNIPILAFGLSEKDSIKRAVMGEKNGHDDPLKKRDCQIKRLQVK